MKFHIQPECRPLAYAIARLAFSKKTIMRVNLTFILILITLMQVSASGFAQKITLSKKNITLQQLFKEIKAQSGYDFLYEPQELRNFKRININVEGAELKTILDGVFDKQTLTYVIDQNTIVVSRKNRPFFDVLLDSFKLISIKGKITDEKNIPLVGATVKVKGVGKSAITNSEGEFELAGVERKMVLIVSYVGYKTKEVTIEESTVFNIEMEPESSNLEQVMVTGYQTISKERATGSFTQIGRDVLNNRPVSNLSSALQGTVAGLQAKEKEDGSFDFLIRGNSSLYADKNPLVVVDGFPVSASDFSDINPNDVESVTVLKDAAAASIWGARAANGVIVVVTKKLKGASKLKVEANVFTRISDKLNLNQVLTQANSADQVAYERRAYENNWAVYGYSGSFNNLQNSLTLAQELLYGNRDGKVSTVDMNAGLDRLSKTNNRSQIQNLLTQRAILDQFNVNLQSGTERSKSYTSIMYEKNKGNYVKNKYDRFNFNFNNSYALTKFLNFNFTTNLQYKKNENSGATIDEIQALSPYEMLLNPDGSYGTNLNTYNREQLALIPSDKFPYSDWSYNLLREVRGRSKTNQTLNARIQAGLNIKIVDGLTFDTKIQYERVKNDYKDYFDESTFYVRNLVNSMTSYNNNTSTIGKSYIPKGGILQGRNMEIYPGYYEDIPNTDQESYVFRNQFNFDKNINTKHNISVIAGTEISKSTTNSRANPYAYGYYADRLQSTTPPYGYGSSVDPFIGLGGYPGVIVPGGNTIFGWELRKFVSFYGNASYNYDNRYTLSGSIRSDASNFITDDPKLRWSPLWSVGAKWNLRNENFLNNINGLDRLELRLTYGKNGNVESSTSTKALLNVGTSLNPSTGTITAYIADKGNPKLRWEKTTSTNLGVDFALFGNKLFGALDIYNKKGEGIIGIIALPAATGTKSQKFNNAGITNRGVEITLGTNVTIPNTPIHYSTSFTYAYNNNKVNSLYNPSQYVYEYLNGTYVEGRPVNAVYSIDYKGMNNGVPQFAGPNGSLYSANDLQLVYYTLGSYLNENNYEGTATPPHTMGWVNNIEVGHFTLTAVFNGKFGGVYRNPTFNYGSAYVGTGKIFVNQYVNDVLAGNPNIPGFANPNETNLYLWDRYTPYLSSLIESSSYIECKEITLGYTLSKRLLKAMKVENIKVFAQTRDLGLIWGANSKGYNPDWLPGTNRPQQTYTFGINLQF